MENIKATRQAYGEVLKEIGSNENIFVLDADLSSSTKTELFAKEYPKRFLNVGISESDMIGMASGIASTGYTVFASSFAAFLTGRVYDQIRCSICYSNMNVKLVSTHAGLTLGEDGATHQMLEDIALMRALPNMEVWTASTEKITKEVIKKVASTKNPSYVRLYRMDAKEEYSNLTNNEINDAINKGMFAKGIKNVNLKDHQLVLVTMGDMTNIVYEVQNELYEKYNISSLVIDTFCLKPFNSKYFVNIIKNLNEDVSIYTIEDHTIYGGLGSIVSETLSESLPKIVRKIGTTTFGESGKPTELLEKYNLSKNKIISRILREIKNTDEN